VPRAPSFTDLRCRVNAMCVGQELCRDSASVVCELPGIDAVVSKYVVRNGRGTLMTRDEGSDAARDACICWESQGNFEIEEVVRL